MADNFALEATVTAGRTIATDQIGSVDFPRGKLVHGADGVNDGDVSKANPLPIGGNTAADGSGTLVPLLVDAAGNLQIDVISAPTTAVTGTFWQATQPVSAASLPLPSGAATAAKQPALGTAGTASSDVLTVQGIASMTALKVDGSAVTQPVSDGGGSLTVDGTVAVTGTFWQATQPVSLASVPSHDVTNAGTFATQAAQSGTWNIGTVTTVTTCSTVTTVSTLTGSGIAHDAADSGNPHKIGAKATAALSGATLVSAGDRTDLYAGVDGVQITRPHCNLEDVVSGNASNTDGTSTSLIAAQGAGVKTYLTAIILTNTSASNIYVEIKDNTTVKLTIPVPANSGAVVTLPVPLGGTANTAWNFDPSTSATTVYCSAVGFKSKV